MENIKSNTKKIYNAAFWVILLDILMKVIAFGKQSVIAYYYGADAATDIYFVAEGFWTSFTYAVVNSAKVAVIGGYTSLRIREGKEEGDRLIMEFSEVLFVFLCIVLIVSSWFAPGISKLLAPAFTDGQIRQLTMYFRILSGLLLFKGGELVMGAVLNSHERFLVPKLRSFFYSVCVILACIFLSERAGIMALAGAEYVSYIIFTILLVLEVRKYISFRPGSPFKNPHVKKIFLTTIPVILGNSIIEISYMVDKAVASTLEQGAVSALTYSQIIDQLVTTIIIVGISSILFAHFANLVAKRQEEEIKRILRQSISIMILVLVPVSIIVISNALSIVKIIYYRGSFSYSMAVLTAVALQGYAIRYPMDAVSNLSMQGLYAYQETKKPMINAGIVTVINIAVSVGLAGRLGVFAIALGSSTASIIGMFLNMGALKKKIQGCSFHFLWGMLFRNLICILLCLGGIVVQRKYLNLDVEFFNLLIQSAIVFTLYYVGMALLGEKIVVYLWEKGICWVKAKFK